VYKRDINNLFNKPRMKTIGVKLACLLLFLLPGCARISPGMHLDFIRNGCQRYVQAEAMCPVPIIEIDCFLIDELAMKERLKACPSFIDGDCRPYAYRLGVGDRLNIFVWGQPELNNPSGPERHNFEFVYTVNHEGKVVFPYCGEVLVAGKTVEEVRRELNEKVKKIVTIPDVSVDVYEYRSQFVNVIGEVNLPNVIPINDVPLRPLDAISRAGGVTVFGDLQCIRVKRGSEVGEVNLLPRKELACSPPITLEHGDVVYVPSKVNRQVYVLGEVLFPQAITMDSDVMTLSQAITRSGGIEPFASNPQHTYVFREEDNGEKVAYHLKGRNPASYLLANQFPLKKQDIIYVGTYKPAVLNRIMTNFLSTTRVAYDLTRTVDVIRDIVEDKRTFDSD